MNSWCGKFPSCGHQRHYNVPVTWYKKLKIVSAKATTRDPKACLICKFHKMKKISEVLSNANEQHLRLNLSLTNKNFNFQRQENASILIKRTLLSIEEELPAFPVTFIQDSVYRWWHISMVAKHQNSCQQPLAKQRSGHGLSKLFKSIEREKEKEREWVLYTWSW